MIVIGDVHGCYKTLLALIDKIPKKHKKQICFVGDLIDRGPRSNQVVQYVIENGYDCVMGNHEQMMVEWSGKYSDTLWLGNGGDICLESYKTPPDEDKPYLKGPIDEELFEYHKNWMESLPTVIKYDNVKNPEGRILVVSHSLCHNYWDDLHTDDYEKGIKTSEKIIWNRNFSKIEDKGFFNVIGHTIEATNPEITNCYANIDTGAFCGYNKWKIYKQGNIGRLTAIHVPTMTIYEQECVDDLP